MNLNLKTLVSLAICLFASLASAQDLDSQARAKYKLYSDSIVKNDQAKLRSMLSPEFKFVQISDAVLGKDKYLSNVQSLGAMLFNPRVSFVVRGVRQVRNEVHAQVSISMKGEIVDEAGVRHPISSDEKGRIIWARNGDDWKVQSVTVDDVYLVMNGKVAAQQKRVKN